MNIYLASRYSRREELCGYRAELHAIGHRVTSRWLNGKHQISDGGKPIGDHGEALIEGDDGGTSDEAARLRCEFASEDVNDVLDASCIIAFTEPPRSSASRGGRHVEFGIALGLELIRRQHCPSDGPRFRMIVVGYRENLFCWLPFIEYYSTFSKALAMLAACKELNG